VDSDMNSTVTIPPSSPAESGSRPTKIDFGSEVAAIHPDLVSLRRQLHQIPELGSDLSKTQAAVLQALEGLPLASVIRGDRQVWPFVGV